MGLVSDSALVNEYMKHCNINVRTKGYTIKDIFKDYWEDFFNRSSAFKYQRYSSFKCKPDA